jgi:hypothetical protein
MADVNRQVVLVKRPIGMVSDSCFELPEGPIPPGVAIGEAVRSNGGGVVVASKTGHLRLGSVAMALTGWQDYCVTSFDIPDVFRNATEPGPLGGDIAARVIERCPVRQTGLGVPRAVRRAACGGPRHRSAVTAGAVEQAGLATKPGVRVVTG